MKMFLLKNIINMLMTQCNQHFPFAERLISFHSLKTQMNMSNSIPHGSIYEYRYQNGVQFKIKSLKSLRLSSFIVPEDIILILVHQNFTIGMMLESL